MNRALGTIWSVLRTSCPLWVVSIVVALAVWHSVGGVTRSPAQEPPLRNLLRLPPPDDEGGQTSSPGASSETPGPLAKPTTEAPTSETVAESIPRITSEEITLRIQRVQADGELPDAVKSQVVAAYERAIQELAAAEKFRNQAEQFRQQREAIQEEVKRLEAELAEVSATPFLPPSEGMTLEEIQAAVAEAEKRLNAARLQRDAIDEEVTKRNAARQTATQRAEAAQKRLEAAREALAASPDPNQPPALTEAQRILRQTELEAARWELEAIKEELAYYDRADETLLPLRRRVAAQRFRTVETVWNQWQQILAQRRQATAVSRVEQARARIAQLPEPLRALAEEVEKKAGEVADLTTRVNQTHVQLTTVKQQLEELQQQFKATKERMEMVGMTGALGLWLRAQRNKLPETHTLWQRIRKRQDDIRATQWTLLELSDAHSQMPPLEEELTRWRNRLLPLISEDHPEWETNLREVLAEKYTLLDEEVQLYSRWLNDLVDLDNTERAIVRTVEEYRRYIDEHILWIPNTRPVRLSQLSDDLRLTLGVLRRLVSPTTLWDAGHALQIDLGTWPALWVLAGLVLAVWRLALFQERRHLERLAKKVSQGAYHGFWPTLQVLALTVLGTGWWPAVLAFLAWRLGSPINATTMTVAMSHSFWSTAEFLIVFGTLRRLCLPLGLGEAHFRWPSELTLFVRRQLRWFIPAGMVLVYFCTVIHAMGDQRWEAGPGRIVFLLMLLLYAVLGHIMLRPKGSLLQAVRAHHPQSWLYRGRTLWRLLAVGVPVGLMALTLAGYSYTAVQLMQRFRGSLMALLLVGVGEELFNRWLIVRKQRIGWERFRQRMASEPQIVGEAKTEVGGVSPSQAESEPDLAVVGQQTRRLFNTIEVLVVLVALGWIWADILPALGFLRQVRLWRGGPMTAVTTAPSTSSAEPSQAGPIALATPAITLADLLLAVITSVAGLLIAKNIPGLMEMVFSHRLPMEPGLRYALQTITSYCVTGVALIMAAGYLGLRWSQARWLVAALGVGLGFGLQEIFANFVSGLIILFERPIRVGDLVTVGEFSGRVTRIRMRATTILNFERRELIIPNKEFITGRVINWTLTDPVNRVEVAVRVAYGTEPQRVMDILLETAKRNPHVMTDPAPAVVFEGFGDSSVNFRLFAYVSNYDQRLTAINSLHADVYRRLSEEGITIPFPQRDVHLFYESPMPPPSREQAQRPDQAPDEK
ncbi:MAG TPA: mechanosensitive ion channel [Thermogutta sp.]|nr:mechanosensitive ion channel [Thermogutta sp.]HPU05681.1 mechanosensitive ion channel [Thermogutta sp.]